MIPHVEYKTMPLSELKDASYNPRTITADALAGLTASMENFGVVQPIVWNKRTGNIVGGHQRVKVLTVNGVDETMVAVVDLDDAQEKALNVALNNPHISGEFTDGLQGLLEELQDLDGLLYDELRLDKLITVETESGKTNASEEWAGMPDFEDEDKAHRKFVVSFLDEAAVQEFCQRLEIEVTDTTKSVWFPARMREDRSAYAFKS